MPPATREPESTYTQPSTAASATPCRVTGRGDAGFQAPNSFDNSPHVNRAALRYKGFTDDDIDRLERNLPGVFELKYAFRSRTRVSATWALPQRIRLKLVYSPGTIPEATDFICGRQTVECAPHLRDEHVRAV